MLSTGKPGLTVTEINAEALQLRDEVAVIEYVVFTFGDTTITELVVFPVLHE